MRKIIILLIAGSVLSGCNDKKAEKKAVLDSVLNVHNKIMGADDHLMKNKMALDTLIKKNKLPATDSAAILDAKLTLADSAMDTWMHNFDYEQKGKTDDEKIAYLHAQKKQVMAIDSQMSAAVNKSDKYLSKIKTK